MLSDIAQLICALLAILASCELFTNGIEWLGHKLRLSEGVVGSVFAAVGTALPETFIPIVAIFFYGHKQGHEVGIGAIAGAPFMLSTLTLGLFGVFVWRYAHLHKQSQTVSVSQPVICRDLSFFLLAYGIALAFSFVPDHGAMRFIVALALLAIYGIYLQKTFSHEGEHGAVPETLHFQRLTKANTQHMHLIVSQVAVGLCGIIGGAALFVDHIEPLARAIGLPTVILSLIVAPIATELPEKVNSVLWARAGKNTLAMGNITGAMVFQACFPVAFGIVFTPWKLTAGTEITATIALLSAGSFWLLVRIQKLTSWHLIIGAVVYACTIFVLVTQNINTPL